MLGTGEERRVRGEQSGVWAMLFCIDRSTRANEGAYLFSALPQLACVYCKEYLCVYYFLTLALDINPR